MLAQQGTVLALAAFLATGCAANEALFGHGIVVPPNPPIFWPPPPATSISNGKPRGDTFGEAAAQLRSALLAAGYTDARWYPVGVGFAHGFAASTRLEQIETDGGPSTTRWSSFYPEASNLRWLEDARAPKLPGAGRYRVLLIAITDLPIPRPGDHAPPRWNEGTVMDAADMPAMSFPRERGLSSRFHVRTFVYEYASEPGAEVGSFVPSADPHSSPAPVLGTQLTRDLE